MGDGLQETTLQSLNSGKTLRIPLDKNAIFFYLKVEKSIAADRIISLPL
jgi:hypothetical protein